MSSLVDRIDPAEDLRLRLAKPERHPRTVFAITDELEELGELIAANQGEITAEMEAKLDALEGDWTAKVSRTFLFAKDCALQAEKAAAGKEHMAEMETYWKNKARGLRNLVMWAMAQRGRDKVQTHNAKFSRCQSPPSFAWAGDPEKIPERFRRVKPATYELNVSAVKEAQAKGEPLPPEIVVQRGWHLR